VERTGRGPNGTVGDGGRARPRPADDFLFSVYFDFHFAIRNDLADPHAGTVQSYLTLFRDGYLMRFTADDRLFVLTGAGISAESGLATFRGSGGLWNGYRVEEVATPEAWHANPALVWRFYSMRRRDALAAQPNVAHLALAAFEQRIGDRFYLCTQNVDDLHERAGSRRIHHMHGTLFQSRCVCCNVPFPDNALYDTAASLPRCPDCGEPIRPHIVWFGEVPLDMEGIYRELDRATVVLVVGTSGSVYPAAGFVHIANQRGIRTVYVGPEEPVNADAFDEVVKGAATEVLPELL
jgi:NAD-dependent deacetylase